MTHETGEKRNSLYSYAWQGHPPEVDAHPAADAGPDRVRDAVRAGVSLAGRVDVGCTVHPLPPRQRAARRARSVRGRVHAQASDPQLRETTKIYQTSL